MPVVKVLGRYVAVSKRTLASKARFKLWRKKKVRMLTPPKETFGQHIKKQMAHGIRDSAYEEKPKKRWNQR